MAKNEVRTAKTIVPVLLSGGAGVRLWPMSRESYPKQLLCLASDRSMLQETVARVGDRARFADPVVICNEEHRFVIAEQMRQIGVTPQAIVLEPVARNTAAATAVAALIVAERHPDACILLLPADHVIHDREGFLRAVDLAAVAAGEGGLVTFGITPTSPETGYGYIQSGAALGSVEGAFQVRGFTEKPAREVAERLVSGGEHFWNSGMFLFPLEALLREFEAHAPEVLGASRLALAGAAQDLDFLRLGRPAFEGAPSISIDYALMEKTSQAVVVPADIGWTDVGGWPALWEVSAKDDNGNVRVGDVVVQDTRNSYIRSEMTLTAVIGLEDVVVVATDDAILVAAKEQLHHIKSVVEQLKLAGRSEPKIHRRVHRPWGYYQSVHTGDRFQVKRLTVNPGARLSMQKHYHRAEHWVVVNGTALVTRDDEQILLRENESIYIPLGAMHRLENPGKVPLNLIEVQSGAYLGEDDIVRVDDVYGRG